MRDKGGIMMWNYFKGYVMIVVGWNNCIGILNLYRGKNGKNVILGMEVWMWDQNVIFE